MPIAAAALIIRPHAIVALCVPIEHTSKHITLLGMLSLLYLQPTANALAATAACMSAVSLSAASTHCLS